MQKIGVDGKWRVAALVLGDRNLVLLREGDERGARSQLPLTPRRDDLDVGLQRIIREFEAHLVVALAGRAMRDSVGACQPCNLDLLLRDQGAGDRGAEEIEPLI